MKQNSTLKKTIAKYFFVLSAAMAPFVLGAQTMCSDPNTYIYGLTGNGEIYEINMNNGNVTPTPIKDNTYSGNSPKSANALAYNYINGKLYYFKRNVTSGPQEFVSYTPATGTVSMLASSTLTDDTHTGCCNATGTGYFTFDIQGTFHYYNILTNTWTFVTSSLVDQYGNDVSAVIRSQNAGDMAMDGYGNLWLMTASNGNYGLYKMPAPLPTTPVASITVEKIIDPSTATPTGQSFAGIAFNPSGQIYLATKSGNKLYRMDNNYSLTFIGNLSVSDVGNDLTSCSFPMSVLPVTWKSFDAVLNNADQVSLSWEVYEENCKGYTVQYSTDGKTWEDITFIAAQKNHQHVNYYTYTHINNSNGTRYYRIKQADQDGAESYSLIRTLTLSNRIKNHISLWPNPAANELKLMNQDTDNILTHAFIYDLSGNLVVQAKIQQGVNNINISSLPAGIYLVKASDGQGNSFQEKLVKQ